MARKVKDLRSKEQKILGDNIWAEIQSMDTGALNKLIAESTQTVVDAKKELEANPKYKELKEALKDCTAGLSEVKKYQGAKISTALKAREGRGA